MKCIDGNNICHLRYDENFGTVNRFYICKIAISVGYYGKFNFGLYNTLIFGPASFDKCEIKMQQLCEKDNSNKYIILEYKKG